MISYSCIHELAAVDPLKDENLLYINDISNNMLKVGQVYFRIQCDANYIKS